MTVSVPFQPGFTWRKLGYLYFTNSLDYREVLKQNPQWKVTEKPPLGAQLRISPPYTGNGSYGTSQGDFIFNSTETATSSDIFPYDTETDYYDSLYRYTLQGVVDRESINGITFDSDQAVTGNQSG